MKIKSFILFIIAGIFCFFVVSYSSGNYEKLKEEAKEQVSSDALSDASIGNIFNKSLIEEVKKDRSLNDIRALIERNIFAKFVKRVKIIKPRKIVLPKVLPAPKVEKPKEEIKPEDNYFYRGQVVLAGKIAYVLERERDKKTYFVHKGDRLKDFIVLDTSAKKVIISDYDENIKILKKTVKNIMDNKNKSGRKL